MDTQRVEIMAKHLAHPISLMAARVGKPLSEDELALYCEVFVERNLAPAYVITALRSITIRWDKGWWPSADQIALAAAQEQRDALRRGPLVHSEYHKIERDAELDLQERADTRRRKAIPWATAHPDEVDRIKKGIRHQIQVLIEKYPDGVMATKADYRQAFFENAVVTAVLEAERVENFRARQTKIAPKKKAENDPVRIGEVIAA